MDGRVGEGGGVKILGVRWDWELFGLRYVLFVLLILE